MLDILDFVLTVVAKFFVYLLLARCWMVAFRLSFRHPLGEFIRTCTSWMTKPFEGRSLNHKRHIIIPLVLSVGLLFVFYLMRYLLLIKQAPFAGGVSLHNIILLNALKNAILEAGIMFFNMMMAMIIVQAILSWVNPYAPMMEFLLDFTAPFLSPFRKIIPTISGIDFSPMAAIVVCWVFIMALQTVKHGTFFLNSVTIL